MESDVSEKRTEYFMLLEQLSQRDGSIDHQDTENDPHKDHDRGQHDYVENADSEHSACFR